MIFFLLFSFFWFTFLFVPFCPKYVWYFCLICLNCLKNPNFFNFSFFYARIVIIRFFILWIYLHKKTACIAINNTHRLLPSSFKLSNVIYCISRCPTVMQWGIHILASKLLTKIFYAFFLQLIYFIYFTTYIIIQHLSHRIYASY